MKKKNLALIALVAISAVPALASCGKSGSTKTTTTTIDVDAEDTQIVAAAKAALTVASEATEDFTLTTAAAGGARITWTSDNAAITISGANATVTRPTFGSESASVKLTATIVSGNISDTKEFTVTVAALTDESKTITEIKELKDDAQVYARGIVTGFLYGSGTTDPEYKKGFYLTDGTDTIYVYSSEAENLEDNMEVYFGAKVGSYSGAKQLSDVSDLVVLGENATPNYSYATVLKTDAELKAAIDSGADAVGKTYEFLGQVYANSYGSYSLEPLDYENYSASWGVYFSGSTSKDMKYYGAELAGKKVVRVVFFINSTNSSSKGRGNILEVKELSDEDKIAGLQVVLDSAVTLDGLYTEDATVTLPKALDGDFAEFGVTWSLTTDSSTNAELSAADDGTQSLTITAGTSVESFTLVGTVTYTAVEDVYTAVDQTTVTAPVDGTTYYTLADGVYTAATDLTAWAADTTYYTLEEDKEVTKTATVELASQSVKLSSIEFKDITEAIDGLSKGNTIALKGVITNIVKGDNITLNDGTTEFILFKGLAEDSVYAEEDLAVGDYVSVLGTYSPYNGIEETATKTANVVVKAEASDATKAAITLSEYAFNDYLEDVSEGELATKGTIFEDVAVNWSVSSESTTTTITDNKLTVTRGTANEEVTIKATVTIGEVTTSKEFTFKVYDTKTANAHSTVTSNTTANAEGINLTTTLGLDDDIFEVTYAKGDSSNDTAIRTDGVRLYGSKGKANGNSLTFTTETGYKIDWVLIQFDSESDGACAVVKAGDTVLTAADGVYTVNGTTFTLIDDNSKVTKNTQVRFQRIVIHYSVVE